MATNDKTNIWVGDTIPIEFECLEPVAEDENTFVFATTPLYPSDAVVKVWSVNDQAFLDISAGADPTEDAATITQNIISYVVSGDHTATSGDLKVFVTATFPDGQVVTEMRQYRVKEKQ